MYDQTVPAEGSYMLSACNYRPEHVLGMTLQPSSYIGVPAAQSMSTAPALQARDLLPRSMDSSPSCDSCWPDSSPEPAEPLSPYMTLTLHRSTLFTCSCVLLLSQVPQKQPVGISNAQLQLSLGS